MVPFICETKLQIDMDKIKGGATLRYFQNFLKKNIVNVITNIGINSSIRYVQFFLYEWSISLLGLIRKTGKIVTEKVRLGKQATLQKWKNLQKHSVQAIKN